MKYFHAENAGRGLIGGVHFSIYDRVAGTAVGVYAVEDSLAGALQALVGNPTSAVTEISQAEYDACVKKKLPSSPSFQSWNEPWRPATLPIKGTVAAVVVNEPNPQVEEPDAPVQIDGKLERAEEALKLAEVEKPRVEPSTPTPTPTKSNRSKK